MWECFVLTFSRSLAMLRPNRALPKRATLMQERLQTRRLCCQVNPRRPQRVIWRSQLQTPDDRGISLDDASCARTAERGVTKGVLA